MKTKKAFAFQSQTQKGFTLIEIMIVTGLIALLATIAIPSFVRARTAAQTQACLENLRQIETAKQTWALETGKAGNTPVAEADVVPSYVKVAPECPGGGTYDYKTVSDPVVCLTGGVTTPGHSQ